MTAPALTLWRISGHDALDGIGAARFGGRWNNPGLPVVYLGESAAGAMLETLVHLSQDDNDLPNSYRLLRIDSPAPSSIVTLDIPEAASWQTNLKLTQSTGTAWLQSGQSAFARVPSAVVPRTWNYLLNPLHAEAENATVAEISEHLYDPRLLRRKRYSGPSAR